MYVRDAMTNQVFACRVDEPLSAAAGMMWDHDIGAVPIVDAEGKLAGIITDRDICMAGYFTGKPLHAEQIGAHMSREVFTTSPGDTVESAEELMRSKQIRRLPVLDATGGLVGMVSLSDLARTAAERGRKVLDANEVTATIAAVVRPRTALAATA